MQRASIEQHDTIETRRLLLGVSFGTPVAMANGPTDKLWVAAFRSRKLPVCALSKSLIWQRHPPDLARDPTSAIYQSEAVMRRSV